MWFGTSLTPSETATCWGASAGSKIAASSQYQTPSGYAARTASATCKARRVLPIPPGPVRVTQQPPHPGDVVLAPVKARNLARQVVTEAAPRGSRGNAGWKIRSRSDQTHFSPTLERLPLAVDAQLVVHLLDVPARRTDRQGQADGDLAAGQAFSQQG